MIIKQFFLFTKKTFSREKIFSIQNGFRNSLFFNNLKKFQDLKIDYFFGFNKSFCDHYKNIFRQKLL